jgi:hypothetical protein
MSENIIGKVTQMPISNLRLDHENPRIPEDRRAETQVGLACELVINENSFEIAQSIALQGFYLHNAIIAIPTDNEKIFTVVEGNRRLSALMGLIDKNFRDEYFDSQAWEELAKSVNLTYDTTIPVLVMPDRVSVVSIIGNHHLIGIKSWSPFSQANYISTLLETYNMTPDEAAKALQLKKPEMMEKYRELQIARQAGDLNMDTARIETHFSLLTVAMGNPKIREFIAAPTASNVAVQVPPISDEKTSELKELITYIYGDGEIEPRIADSRQMTALGKALSSPESLKVLREGGSLEEANEKLAPAPMSTSAQLEAKLTTAKKALEGAASTALEVTDELDFADLLNEISIALEKVKKQIIS